MLEIPASLLPADGRFGCGPAKVRRAAVQAVAQSPLMGTSHRQAPVRELVGRIRDEIAQLYQLPEGYEVLLGNGGSTLVWDAAVAGLIRERSGHAVCGEFSQKFASAAAAAPHLAEPVVTAYEAGTAGLPEPSEDVDVYAWAHNETSTGAATPVRRIDGSDALVVVDGTSAAGGMELDASQVDFYYFAPQKNLGSDGGLWLSLASPAAIERIEELAPQRWIPATLSLREALTNSRQQQTLNTPALATLIMLESQLAWLLDTGGLAGAAQRCRDNASVIYGWADQRPEATCFVADPEHRSPVVATIDLDASVDAAQVAATLRSNGIVDVEPYRKLGRNQLRIALFTTIDTADLRALTRCIDFVLDAGA
ncbi:phosphoserine transaminase [Parenemella sanctibonifatiensis]|uniref:phosphoserine transaminase n=1 Tax=Parenemella sanctibonifatiensis TaxID=2016505 RepID=A0A255EA54_9ACTN|nr:phosphoserine transaminase [Parenemella sanctibonifatiensis]OYN88439.1 phosphoserine transaminase [Parenemella sanctibonifatiensis]